MSVQEATQGGRVRISVVMPAYNREEYIGEAIDSILCQTIEDFELLVIDDGSTDGTVKIVEEKYSRDRRVRLLKNARNLGIAFTRNIGIYESRGEYIAFMDSDDISLPSRL